MVGVCDVQRIATRAKAKASEGEAGGPTPCTARSISHNAGDGISKTYSGECPVSHYVNVSPPLALVAFRMVCVRRYP